jgi:hypothetical protein
VSVGDKAVVALVILALGGAGVSAAIATHHDALRKQAECRAAFVASRTGSDSLNILRVAPHCAEALP